MFDRSVQLAGLSCRVVDTVPEGQTPDLVVVFCHGFGAPGTDLVPLAGELLRMNGNLAGRVTFVFPSAALSLEQYGMFGARAWWMLDVEKLQTAIARGEFRDLRNDHPPGLVEARQQLTRLIEELQQQTGLPASRFLLGGFSQGAMLTIDVMLRLPEKVAGLCVFSGTVICEEEWRQLALQRGALPVLQSHGRQDPILPFEGALWLKDLLTEAGLEIDFIEFDGPHTIPYEALERTARLIEQLAEE